MDGISASDPISRSGRTGDRDADRALPQRRRKRSDRKPKKPAEAARDEAADVDTNRAEDDTSERDSPTRGANVDITV